MKITMPKSSSRARYFRILYFFSVLYFLSVPLHGEHTRRWRQSTYEEFLKGTAHGVAVRSDGRLELAPKFTLLADADASYLWTVRLDSKGAPFAAGGSPAKVFRFDSNGKPTAVFDSPDLSAQTIAFDSKGTLFVGTSPEGQVFAVAPDGKSGLFYASDEAHIRVLAFDSTGNLIAGTEPSGRILRISRSSGKSAADGFVLYETSKREVTSLAVAADGAIYASAIGEKPRPGGSAPNIVIATPQGTTTLTTGGQISSGQSQLQQQFVPFPPLLSSSIYRLSADGAPEELWSSREDVVYTLGLASDGRLLAGTGNNGALLAVDGRGVFAQLAKAGSAQITGIARNSSGKVYLCTANPGKVFSLGPEYAAEGTYESRSFDSQLFSQWGRLEWWGPPPSAPDKYSSHSNASRSNASHIDDPRLEFFVRTGNTEDPSKEWSRWFATYSQSRTAIEAPSARFVQWKAVIHDGRSGDGIEWVSLAYLPRNVAPVIDGIALQEPGIRAQSQSTIGASQPTVVTLKQPPSPNTTGVTITQSSAPARFELPPQGTLQKGYQSVLWSAHDDNDDELRHAVYFRGETEHEWKLLKDNLSRNSIPGIPPRSPMVRTT